MKNTKRNKINLIFSSFLIIGYIVCSYFFSTLANQVAGTLGSVIQVLILVLFGLLLFYATRVGEGRQVRRFSLAVLLLVDLPCIYILLASYIAALPFHDALASVSTVMGAQTVANSQSIVMMLAGIALGYGIPYTFLSGYEMQYDDEPEPEIDALEVPLEGGLAEELAQTEAEEIAADEEAVEEAVEVQKTPEEEEAPEAEAAPETEEPAAPVSDEKAVVDAVNKLLEEED